MRRFQASCSQMQHIIAVTVASRELLNAVKEFFAAQLCYINCSTPSLNDLVKTLLGVSSPQGKPGLPGFGPQVVRHFFLFNLVPDLLG